MINFKGDINIIMIQIKSFKYKGKAFYNDKEFGYAVGMQYICKFSSHNFNNFWRWTVTVWDKTPDPLHCDDKNVWFYIYHILHISQQDESSMKVLPKQLKIKKLTLQYSVSESYIIEQHCVSYRDCTKWDKLWKEGEEGILGLCYGTTSFTQKDKPLILHLG